MTANMLDDQPTTLWHRPESLNRVADLLFAAALLLAIYGALLYVVRLPIFPIRQIQLSGGVTHVTREQIEAVARRELKGNFFTIDLAASRRAFEKLPWVRAVQIRRHWPGRLDVALEEHVPLARWGGVALVNLQGEVFEAAFDGTLPVFMGPTGTAKEMAIQYELFRRRLAEIGKRPVHVQLNQRQAWQVKLDDGAVLELGREQIEARLSRFLAAYDRTVAPLRRRVEYIDLRYANGFAVRIPELRQEKGAAAGSRRS